MIVIPVKDAAAGKTRLSGSLDDRSRAALARAMALDTIAAAAACPLVGAVVVVTPDAVVAGEAGEAARTAPLHLAGSAARDPGGDSVRADRNTGAFVRVVPEPPHQGARSGLDAAAAAGVTAARALVPAAPVGVLLGDLPALRPDDLAEALTLAETLTLGEVLTLAEVPTLAQEPTLAEVPTPAEEPTLAEVPTLAEASTLAEVPTLAGVPTLAEAPSLAGARSRAMVADSSGTGTTLLTIAAGSSFDSRFGVGSAAAHAAIGYTPLGVDPESTLRRDVDLPADLEVLRRLRLGSRTARLLDRLTVGEGPAPTGGSVA